MSSSVPTTAQTGSDYREDDEEANRQRKNEPQIESRSSVFLHLEWGMIRSFRSFRSFRADQLSTEDTCIDMAQDGKQRDERTSSHGRSFSRLTGSLSRFPVTNQTGTSADPNTT
ncbi:hypothetical protein PC129_g14398 [Phytophthora cactorum]|uniref:Uncharacterized protein n=1 Tax=Phytophthora cactorum TaxID=29920 RepID=A0A329S305_9STRA|nr:hypothetical protein Pcac1_g24212 [Phytophthora cactorum]KAG2814485.1 hypothetical protein PC112_g14292 [Phytophthora cactorum]KAG2816138.1 hypothetical protein PC111_g13267 [Phytophthora cactorum]KAG2853000.1 hypothetical protein PC113_g14545 [Phytophthora cactorum]KAG2895299.1 hypothetical protein PC114_g15530 [Phytophthora cactorum]